MTHRAISEARACITAYIEDGDTEWLVKARRFVGQAVAGDPKAEFWNTAFSVATRDLELAGIVGGHTSEQAQECYRLLAAVEGELNSQR